MSKAIDHDAYIATAPEQLRPLLENLRAQLSYTLPDAEEVIAYNMPGFRVGKTIVVGYAAFSKQCGIYVAPDAISSLSQEIEEAGFRPTKTGVTFSLSKPLSDKLIKKLAHASREAHGL